MVISLIYYEILTNYAVLVILVNLFKKLVKILLTDGKIGDTILLSETI